MPPDPVQEKKYSALKVRQAIMTGHVRYILGISLSLSIIALIVVYLLR